MERFPFPGRELALEELRLDVCYHKIPQCDVDEVVSRAWESGAAATAMVWEEQRGNSNFYEIAVKSGLTVEYVDQDFVVGNRRFFSDYFSGKGLVRLYQRAVAAWSAANGLEQHVAENLILMHEYYHFLEWTRLGLTSKQYQVPMITAFGKKIGRTGIRALSEIGAHSFARTYYERGEAP